MGLKEIVDIGILCYGGVLAVTYSGKYWSYRMVKPELARTEEEKRYVKAIKWFKRIPFPFDKLYYEKKVYDSIDPSKNKSTAGNHVKNLNSV